MISSTYQDDMPMVFRKILLVVAFGKAAVAGAGLALALLGALDVAAAVSAGKWLSEAQNLLALDGAAALGGAAGIVAKAFIR